ncbi:nucleotidyltransferase domain-containing protein [Kitasatospora aureofaciens]|uniref:nucleotidyltransferase domain-containing protein n=1 Tax=Kitasatospora aureofaciens TaxID=1894 RepID=UPI0033C56ACF
MKRGRATELVQAMLTRLDRGERPLELVEEVYLFGSYVRGALDPHDVDVAVQHAVDEAFARHQVSAMLAGRDPYASMKKALTGSTRGLSLQFQQRDDLVADGIELTLLWRRGDTLAKAERRLAAMKPDPKAGSAPRDHMLPAFEGLERWLPRPARIDLFGLHAAGAIEITALTLDDALPASRAAVRWLEQRWSDDSPLRRAASASLAYLETVRGLAINEIELHGQSAGRNSAAVRCFVDLGWRYFDILRDRIADGQEWLEVIRPTRTRPLHALWITSKRSHSIAETSG